MCGYEMGNVILYTLLERALSCCMCNMVPWKTDHSTWLLKKCSWVWFKLSTNLRHMTTHLHGMKHLKRIRHNYAYKHTNMRGSHWRKEDHITVCCTQSFSSEWNMFKPKPNLCKYSRTDIEEKTYNLAKHRVAQQLKQQEWVINGWVTLSADEPDTIIQSRMWWKWLIWWLRLQKLEWHGTLFNFNKCKN